MRLAGYVASIGKRTGAYCVLVGSHAGRKPFERSIRRWDDNIKVVFKEVEWGAWTGLMWLRIMTGSELL